MLEHNKIVYDEVIERLKTSSRVCIVQATGTGKGVIARSLIEDYGNVLVIAPTFSILENYKMNLGVNNKNVIFYTYQGITALLNNQIEEFGENVSLIILDEFHRIGAETWGRKVEMLCDRAEAKGCKTVGLSATPVRYLDNERDMSEEFFKGNVVNGLNIVDAVVSGVLPTFKYVVSYYGYEKAIKNKLSADKIKITDDIKKILLDIDNNYNIGEIIRKETIDLDKNQKWIIFFNTIEELENFKDKIQFWFGENINLFILHSYYNRNKKIEILNEFNESLSGINVILSVNMLNEGVHVKNIDGIVMLRRTISPIIYLQQLGRALQIGGKEPIIFDFIGNFKRVNDFYNNLGIFDFISEINEKLEEKEKKEKEYKTIKKVIINSYCEEILELFEKLNFITRPRWTEEEDEILYKYYSEMSVKEIQDKYLPYKNCISIRQRASRLGIVSGCFWTEEENNILKEYYGVMRHEELKNKFLPNRTISSIRKQGRILGLRGLGVCENREGFSRNGHKLWTKEEDLLLIESFKTMTAREIQESILPNRNIKSIYKRLENLGMYNRKLSERKKRKEWAPEEIDILNKYFNSEDIESILVYLPCRDKKSILQKAESLGIYERQKRDTSSSKPCIWSEKEDEILKEYFITEGYNVIKRLKNKNKNSIKHRVYKLNLQTIVNNRKNNGNNNGNNIWTDEEKEILKKHYKHLGSAIPELLLNRSVESIRTQAGKLGLSYERQDIWTDEEIELLKENYSKLGTSIASILPNRSKSAVESKAKKLGFKFVRPDVWTEEEIVILKENFYSLGYSISGTLLNRSIEAIKHKVKELHLQSNSYNTKKWTAEEESIMRLYYSKENITKVYDMLNRSKDSIYKKAARMGLRCN